MTTICSGRQVEMVSPEGTLFWVGQRSGIDIPAPPLGPLIYVIRGVSTYASEFHQRWITAPVLRLNKGGRQRPLASACAEALNDLLRASTRAYLILKTDGRIRARQWATQLLNGAGCDSLPDDELTLSR